MGQLPYVYTDRALSPAQSQDGQPQLPAHATGIELMSPQAITSPFAETAAAIHKEEKTYVIM